MSAPTIAIEDADLEMMNLLADKHEIANDKAVIYRKEADNLGELRQAYIRSLIRRAGAPLNVTYRLSPDGKLLAPVEGPLQMPAMPPPEPPVIPGV